MLWLATVSQFGYAEESNNASVVVIRKDNLQPLTDAIIKVIPLNEANRRAKEFTGITDINGIFNYAFTEASIIQISHLGFLTLTDTLLKSERKIYKSVPASLDIHDVVVTGQYAPNSVQKSVYEVKVISADELKSRGANNLREALQNKLNIDLGQDAVFGSSLGINGISGEGVKIMVDGIPIVGRLDGKLDLSQINLNNIDHIEIVEGPLSVIYGTDAMGGVINIITKTFQAEKVNLNLKGYYETVGQYNIELNTGFAFKKSQVYLSGGRNFFGGFTTLDSIPRFKEWKPKEQYFADAKYIYTADRFRVSLTGSFFRELMLDRGTPKLSFSSIDHTWTYAGDDMHYLNYRPRATVSFMYRFKESNQLDMLLGYSGFYRYANKYFKNLVSGSEQLVDDKNEQDTSRYHQVTARATYTLPAWKYRLNFLFGVDINQEFIWQNSIVGEKKQSGDYAAFGSAKISVVEGLDIQPAVRFSYNTLYKSPLVPSLNVKYNWKDKLVFRAAYGRGFRVPSLKELYFNLLITAHNIKGNPNLKSEDGHNANASVNYYFSHEKHSATFNASGFFNYIFNKIELVRINDSGTNPTPTFQYFNYKNYSTYGGQVGINYRWDRLQISSSIQLTGYHIIYQATDSGSVKTWSTDFTTSATYLIPKAEINVYIGYKFDGVKPLISIDNQFHAGIRHAFHLLDVSLSRSFWKDRIQLTIGGKNLLGVTNVRTERVEAQGHNVDPNSVNVAWGRTFFTSLILHFSK